MTIISMRGIMRTGFAPGISPVEMTGFESLTCSNWTVFPTDSSKNDFRTTQ
jgi:hypothetical protein